jgi:hypothetical protein
MSLTIDEYRGRQPRPVAKPPDTTFIRAIAQEVVRMEALTGSDTWDWFLRYLEANIKAATRDLEARKAMLADPLAQDDEKLRQQRAMIFVIQSRIETLTEVMLLPKMLMHNGERARGMIAEMEHDAN